MSLGLQTTRMIESFLDQSPSPMFFASQFQTPANNFHNSEKVQIDIQRSTSKVAITIVDVTAGAQENKASVWTAKEFKPPPFLEQGSISAYDLQKRTAGVNEYVPPEEAANRTRQAFQIFRICEEKVRRSVELMCSQVLQTGTVTLTDGAGNVLYTISFDPKTTHFINAPGGVWSGGTPDIFGDINTMAQRVNHDGNVRSNQLIFGDAAWNTFIQRDEVKSALDTRRVDLGEVGRPQIRTELGAFHGQLSVGNFTFDLWSYDGHYEDPITGNITSFMDPNKVIVKSRSTRLDLTYGSIAYVAPPDPRVIPFLPPRISGTAQGVDLTTNAWISIDNRALMVSAGTRPLPIPTQIDGFGALTVLGF